MNVAQVLQKKRDGNALEESEIRCLVKGYTEGSIPDYQMAAFLAFVYCRGMNADETRVLTMCMMESGQVLEWPKEGGFYVDKHSTGGIGDKISLILAPLVASCGVKVPMISGRGLGHTGGTLDKLEALEGFRVDLSVDAFKAAVASAGCAIVAQTADVCPADKKVYGLRDVTGTVPSLPLIVSSIMCKKLAEGVDGLVLDVKWGSGAFMKTVAEARELGEAMVAVGKLMGKKMVALVTDMNQPLGRAVGNALEVQEVLDVLRGAGGAYPELLEVTKALAAEMLVMSGKADDLIGAEAMLSAKLADGSALRVFEAMAQAQGAKLPLSLPKAPHVTPVPALEAGMVAAIDSEAVGWAAIALGAGRRRTTDTVDPRVGFTALAKLGETMSKGQTIALIHHADPDHAAPAIAAIQKAYLIAPAMSTPRGAMVVERIS